MTKFSATRRGGAYALATILLTGCPGFGDLTLEDLAEPPPAVPTWDGEVQALLMANCAGCHTDPPVAGAPASFRLDKYTTADIDDGGKLGALEKIDRILARAVNNDPTPMPPGAPLDVELRVTLEKWIDSGAPRGAPAAPTWDNQIQALLMTNCAGCHTDPPAGGAPDSFRLDKYTTADIDDGGKLGAREKADRIFARAVNNEPSEMPPGAALGVDLKAALGEWVMAGAPRSGGGQ